jgi:hypothetical protein
MNCTRLFGVATMLALSALLPSGCGRGLPPTTDVPSAKAALTTALDAWKDGKSNESLREGTPSIDFRDINWDKGSKLSKYSIEKEETSGLSARFTVKLTLADKAGETRDRVVVYNADAGKGFVIRPDFSP